MNLFQNYPRLSGFILILIIFSIITILLIVIGFGIVIFLLLIYLYSQKEPKIIKGQAISIIPELVEDEWVIPYTCKKITDKSKFRSIEECQKLSDDIIKYAWKNDDDYKNSMNPSINDITDQSFFIINDFCKKYPDRLTIDYHSIKNNYKSNLDEIFKK